MVQLNGKVQATAQDRQKTQTHLLVALGCGTGPCMVPRLGWVGTISLLNHDFLFPAFWTFTNHICKVSGGLRTCLNHFNRDYYNMDRVARAQVARKIEYASS